MASGRLDEQKRLDRIAAPWRKMAEDLGRGIKSDIIGAEWNEGLDAIEAEIEASQKMQRLMKVVRAAMPQWHGSGLTFGAALRRYWPR